MRISSAGSISKSRNAKRFLITQKGERRFPLNGGIGLRQIPILRASIYGCAQVAGHCTLSKDPADFTIGGISADIKRVREDSMKKIAIVTGASRGIGRERSTRQRFTVFTLSGRMEAAQVPELKELFDRDYRNIIPDLRSTTCRNTHSWEPHKFWGSRPRQ